MVTDELVDEVTEFVADGVSDQDFKKVLDVLNSERATPEQIVTIVESLLEADIDSDQAAQIVANPEVLQAVSADQATELFEVIDEGELTAEQGEAIVAAVQEAPKQVREAFEETIDVFSGAFDGYVPIDSVVSIAVRRVVIGATVVVFSMPAPTVRKI